VDPTALLVKTSTDTKTKPKSNSNPTNSNKDNKDKTMLAAKSSRKALAPLKHKSTYKRSPSLSGVIALRMLSPLNKFQTLNTTSTLSIP
jgi:hypothetical protein